MCSTRRTRTLPPDATDADLLAAVRSWVDLLAAGEYAQAQGMLVRVEQERDWPAVRVAEVIAAYEPRPQARAEGAVRVTPVRTARVADVLPRHAVARWGEGCRPGVVGDIHFDLPINGAWSDLMANFFFRRVPGGLALELWDLHVVGGSMTEWEWLAHADPTAMLQFLRHRASDRQYRLFAVACARDDLARARAGQGFYQFGDELGPGLAESFWDPERGYEAAVLAAESAADGRPRQHFSRWYVGWGGEDECIAFAALGYDPDGLVATPAERIAATVQRYTNPPAVYLRDIFGNPFRPVAFSPAWHTDTALALAREIYEERDSSALPILADALEDAGCTNPDLLGHLRASGPHVRGCWAVDLVLAHAAESQGRAEAASRGDVEVGDEKQVVESEGGHAAGPPKRPWWRFW
jgi:hypothetical protein